MAGSAEFGRETGRGQVTWSDTLRHRPTPLLPVQHHRRRQRRPIRRGRRCRSLRLRLRPDFVRRLPLRLWATRACASSAVPARVSCQLCWSVAEGMTFTPVSVVPFCRVACIWAGLKESVELHYSDKCFQGKNFDHFTRAKRSQKDTESRSTLLASWQNESTCGGWDHNHDFCWILF